MAAQSCLGEKSLAVYKVVNLMKTDKEEKKYSRKKNSIEVTFINPVLKIVTEVQCLFQMYKRNLFQ